jgi:hypothetical protein
VSRRSRHAIFAGALNLVLLWTPACAQSQVAHKLIPSDKTPGLVKQGYVEVSGADAVTFLVGNSILMRSKDWPPIYQQTADDDHDLYFLDSGFVYDCRNENCSLEHWTLVDEKLCLLPVGCEELSFKQLNAPTLLKAPRRDRSRDLGVFLEFKRVTHRVVRGHSADVPLFDPNGRGIRIEFDRDDLAKDIGDQPLDGDRRAILRGSRTATLRIGNTFASAETLKDASGHDHWCPTQGYYYSLDGRIIVFNCEGGGSGWPAMWSFLTLRWKMEGDKFCLEDAETRTFSCREFPLWAYLDQGGTKVVVTEDDFPRRVVAYTGNVFNIHFENTRHRQ